MKSVAIHTYHNDLFREKLTREGFTVRNLPQKPDPSFHYIIDRGLLTDLSPDFFPRISRGTIILADEITGELKELLAKRGLVNLLTDKSPEKISAYLQMLSMTDKHTGKSEILIGEDDPAIKAILFGLVRRFGFKPVFAGSVKDFFQHLSSPNLQFLLLNLGMKNLDINGFIREASGRMEIKRLPFIAYRDMQDGIFINEVICGLNRLTRFILSPMELYNMLTGLLYRKELIPSVYNLTRITCLEDHKTFAEESIQKIYHQHREELFSLPDLAAPDLLVKITDFSQRLHQSVIKIEGLRWLLDSNDSALANTCGLGG